MNELLTYSTIVGLVVVVLLSGLFVTATNYSFTYGSGATGFVVSEEVEEDVCSSCFGYDPVCAQISDVRLDTFANECEARCSDARIVFFDHCGAIPTN